MDERTVANRVPRLEADNGVDTGRLRADTHPRVTSPQDLFLHLAEVGSALRQCRDIQPLDDDDAVEPGGVSWSPHQHAYPIVGSITWCHVLEAVRRPCADAAVRTRCPLEKISVLDVAGVAEISRVHRPEGLASCAAR